MKYKICIEETVVGNFEVEANSREEALEMAKYKYYNCEFVNEPGELVEKKISVNASGDNNFIWNRF